MYKIILITGFVDSNFKYREEIYYDYFKKNGYNIFLISSYYSPPQKKNEKVSNVVGENHYRVKSIFKFNDIVILPIFTRFKAIQPDLVHLFDAQQLVGLIPFLYCKIYNIPFVYEHELRSVPTSFLGKIRFYFFIRPLIKLYSKNAALIRTVTPAATKLILNCFRNKRSIKNKIEESTLLFKNNYKINLFTGFKSDSRILNLAFSGKVDDLKFSLIINFLNSIIDIKTSKIIFHFILDFNKQQIEIINSIFHNTENFTCMYHGLMPNEMYLNLLVKFDGAIFIAPTISYFEAIGCNLPILVKSDENSNHLTSKNIFKYNFETLNIDFLNFLNSVKHFYYSTDDTFSEKNVVKKLEEQYLNILNRV